MKQLETHGDLIERLNYQFIVNRLPNYERIWEKIFSRKYNGLSEQVAKQLRLVAEYQFTCLESLMCMKLISQKKHAAELSEKYKLGEKEFLKGYLELVNDFFVFESHMGRIYETMERIWSELKLTAKEELKEFYHHRHNVIHSHKLPFKVDEKLIAIPELRAQGYPDGWSDRGNYQTWEEFMKSDNFQPLDDYLEDTFNRLCETLNISLYSILSKISDYTRELLDLGYQDSWDIIPPSPSGANINYPPNLF